MKKNDLQKQKEKMINMADRMLMKYNASFDYIDKTLLIDKPIPVQEFVFLKKYYSKFYGINNILVNYRASRLKH